MDLIRRALRAGGTPRYGRVMAAGFVGCLLGGLAATQLAVSAVGCVVIGGLVAQVIYLGYDGWQDQRSRGST